MELSPFALSLVELVTFACQNAFSEANRTDSSASHPKRSVYYGILEPCGVVCTNGKQQCYLVLVRVLSCGTRKLFASLHHILAITPCPNPLPRLRNDQPRGRRRLLPRYPFCTRMATVDLGRLRDGMMYMFMRHQNCDM